MTSGLLSVAVAGHELVLHPDRAVFCPSHRALLLADVHLGKALSFRSLGVPVPAGTTERTFERLDRLIAAFRPDALFVLGDLVHGPAVRESNLYETLARWRRGHAAVHMAVVIGNHDVRSGALPAECGIEPIEEGHVLGPWALCHEPADCAGLYGLSGHLHPAYRLRGRVDSIRLPAFWLRERHAVLPAFGEFTGGAPLPLQAQDRVFVTDGERVHAVPSAGRHPSRAAA